MSKLRGQGRLLVLMVAAVVAIYLAYSFLGRPSVTDARLPKDSRVLKYHQLAGKVDVRHHVNEQDHQRSQDRPPSLVKNLAIDNDMPLARKPPLEDQDELRREDNFDDKKIDDVFHREDNKNSEEDQIDEPVTDDDGLDGDEGREQEVQHHRKKFSAFVPKSEPVPLDLYTDPNPKYTHFFSDKERLVHLDLKGAPPKMSYLEKVIPLFRRLGATGLLIEYEDMFPYTKNLETIAAKNAYTVEDIKKINTLAKENQLKVIPLVQTFGHMEFVLKGSTYMNLREFPDNPQVVMPTHQGSLLVIKAMIEQVVALHPGIEHFHIGCDEVYQLGEGKSKQILAEKQMTKEELFFSHVRNVAKFVRERSLQPIMWDDMFRFLNESTLQNSGLGGLVQPMVWQYIQQPQVKLPVDIWPKYGKVFNNVWVASSFKGATGSAQYITDASYHLENHLNWVEIMKKFGGDPSKQYVNFKGTALTGWQRYDHFATLCELLPVAIPSLAVCLQTLKNGYFNEALHADISKKYLECDSVVELRLLSAEMDKSYCHFPGYKLYYAVKTLYAIHKDRLDSDRIKFRLEGWVSKYNIMHNFTSPGQYKVFKKYVETIRQDLLNLRAELQKILLDMYNQDTVEEFLLVQIDGQVDKIDNWLVQFKSKSSRHIWPRRPLKADEQDDAHETLILSNQANEVEKESGKVAQQVPDNTNRKAQGVVPPKGPSEEGQLPRAELKGNTERPKISSRILKKPDNEPQRNAFADNNMLIGGQEGKNGVDGNRFSGEKGNLQPALPGQNHPAVFGHQPENRNQGPDAGHPLLQQKNPLNQPGEGIPGEAEKGEDIEHLPGKGNNPENKRVLPEIPLKGLQRQQGGDSLQNFQRYRQQIVQDGVVEGGKNVDVNANADDVNNRRVDVKVQDMHDAKNRRSAQ